MATITVTKQPLDQYDPADPDDYPYSPAIFVSHDYTEPTGPLCEKKDCTSLKCRSGHPEVDHDVWNEWMKVELAKMEGYIRQAVSEGLMPDPGKVRFRQNAGCHMCPCSPGFITYDLHGDDAGMYFLSVLEG